MMKKLFLILFVLSVFTGIINAQDIYRVKADKLRVRESNDSKSKVIGNIYQDENVAVLDTADGKFYKVKLKSSAGWVDKAYLTKITVKTSTTPANSVQPTSNASGSNTEDIYQVTTDNLRVRENADAKSKIIGYLPEGENVAVTDSTNKVYFKIKVKNGKGWVSKEFLKRISPVKKAAITETKVKAPVPQDNQNYTSIIFFAIIAIILFAILYFSIKYAGGNKFLIVFAVMVILIISYFFFVTFIQAKLVSGVFSSTEDVQYNTFNFKSRDSVTVTDTYKDTTFTSKYKINGDMIKLYDQQNTIMLLIRDKNTLVGEGFTRGTFIKK